MNSSYRGWMLCMVYSTAAHAIVAGTLVYSPMQPAKHFGGDPEEQHIQINLVPYTPEEPSGYKTEAMARKSTGLLKRRGIPIPRHSLIPDAPEPKQSPLEEELRSKIKEQEAQLLKLSANTDIPGTKLSPQTSSELLTDPIKGKIFVGYFGYVKHAIQDLLVQKYAKRAIGHGSVYLFFVLNDKGALEKVSVMDKESTADEYLRELAIQCLRDAAPFGNFPQSLGAERISFNVTIYFEEQ